MARLHPCVLRVGTVALVVLSTVAAGTAGPDPLKDSRKCRKTIATETVKLVKIAQKLVDRCHAARSTGKPTGNCNSTGGVDPKGSLAKLEAKAAAKIDKTCALDDPVRINFPGGAVRVAIAPGVRGAVEASATALQGAADLVGNKTAQKCHAAIGKVRSGVVDAILKAAVRCQLGLDKGAATFDTLAPTCVGDGGKVASKAAAKIVKACTPRGASLLGGANVGSCDPLPACVVTQATTTGQALAALAFSKPSACGDGFLDLGRGEVCPLLEGAPDALALGATHDFDAGAGVPAAEISLDAAGLEVARTQLEIAFVPTATIAEVNGVLGALGAEIVSMLNGVLVLVVRIPDPGTLEGLDVIRADLAANPLVRYVNRATFPDTAVLPANYGPASTDLPKLDHHLAVWAHAAWNAREALAGGTLPAIVVSDFFGGGLPDGAVDRVDLVGSVGSGATNVHGYHVLGTIAASFAGPVTDRGLATGMFPGTSRVAYVDAVVNPTTTRSGAEANNLLLMLVRNTPGNVVVNTSLQFSCKTPAQVAANCNAVAASAEALTWIEKVRGTIVGPASLEGKFLHLAAGGNVTVAGDLDAKVATEYAAARLLTGLTAPGVFGGPVANLSNTLVVENVLNSTTLPFRPTCLNQSSKRPGDLAGIGTDVWSTTDAATTAGDLTGTSMATPQVAGLAAYVWALAPQLTPQEVAEILLATARPDAQLTGDPRCDTVTPSPVIDAYAAVLATDQAAALTTSGQAGLAPVRVAILDVADGSGAPGTSGSFDEHDVGLFFTELGAGAGALDYSRYDLNGDAATGGSGTDRFDLTIDPSPLYGTLAIPILGAQIVFDEAAVTDFEVLCFYAYSPLYTGDVGVRDALLPDCAERCPKVRLSGRISVGELPECTNNFGGIGALPLPQLHDQTCAIGGLTFQHHAEASGTIDTGAVDLRARRQTTGAVTVFFQSVAAANFSVEEDLTIDAPGMTGQQGTATPSVMVDGTMSASGPCGGFGGASASWGLIGVANGQTMFTTGPHSAAVGNCPDESFTGPDVRVGNAFTFTYGEPFAFLFRFDTQTRAEGGTGSPHQATAVLSYSWGGLAGLAPGATVTSCSGVNWVAAAGP